MSTRLTQTPRKALLEHLDAQKVKNIIFMPYGENGNSKLGDSTMWMPFVRGLSKKFPDSSITVISRRVGLFETIDGVSIEDKIELNQTMVDSGGGTLIIGRTGKKTDSNDEVGRFIQRGGNLIQFQRDNSILFDREGKHEGRTVLSEQDKARIGIPLSISAYAAGIGLECERYPVIDIPDGPKLEEEAELRKMGFSERGDSTRVSFNIFRDSRKGLGLWREDLTKGLLTHVAREGVEVLFDPGVSDKTMEMARKFVDETPFDGKVIIPEDNTPLRRLGPQLSNMDAIITPDTGFMHYGAAIEGPITLGYFIPMVPRSADGMLTNWNPENPKCFPVNDDIEAVKSGFDATILLTEKHPWDIFQDPGKGLKKAREYVKLVGAYDPLLHEGDSSSQQRANAQAKELIDGIKPGFQGFFDLKPVLRDPENSLWFYAHQQRPLFRYLKQMLIIHDIQARNPDLPQPREGGLI